jgi:methionyl-tRNA formyltransferase
MAGTMFLGSKAMGLAVLQTLLELDPDGVVGVQTVDDIGDDRSTFNAFHELCEAFEIPLTVVSDAKDSEAELATVEFDLAIVCGWYWIISNDALERAEKGFYGIHNSTLPHYRGSAPVVWAMLNEEPLIGATLYKLGPDIDDGHVFGNAMTYCTSECYIADVLDRLTGEVVEMVKRNYIYLCGGGFHGRPQDGVPSYGCKRTPADGEIDWSKPARQIYDEVRAQSHPYPGAWTTHSGGQDNVTIWEAEVATITRYGRPGQVASTKGNIVVVCGDNQGLRIIDHSETIHPIKVNDVLGE